MMIVIFLDELLPVVKTTFQALKIQVSIYSFTRADTLIKRFEEYNPYFDLIFMDIDMPFIDGKEAARRLRILDSHFKLVFITAFEQEVLNTLQFNISDFLPKLLLKERMPGVIERVAKSIMQERPQIQIFKVNLSGDRSMIIKVPLDDIIYLECINRKSYLHTRTKKHMKCIVANL
ncbi:LytR/AlgR family response regulator transcription factor [Paenibacillus rhizoplanae]